MTMTDPIADLLTRVRNAVSIDRTRVSMPHSRVKEAVCLVLKQEGFIEDFRVTECETSKKGAAVGKVLTVFLKYGPNGEPVIQKLKRESKPGCRVYRGVNEIPRVLDGLGVAILSTSRGVMSDRKCREEHVGGELLCTVY